VIDWLTFRASVSEHDPVANGAVVKMGSDGEVEWVTGARMALAGSYDPSIYIRSIDARNIEISGNAVKHYQGHNLWGSNDVPSLAGVLLADVEETLGLEVRKVRPLSRVDIAGLLDLGEPAVVQDVLRSLGQAATMRNRGRGNNADEGTVYWGKRSRRWSLKIYDKQREVVSTKATSDVATTSALAAGKLRVEVVLRGLQLDEMNLRHLEQWSTVDAMHLLRDFLAKLELPDQAPRLDVALLPRHLRAPFFQWAQGDDLRALYPKPTFYRYRKQLLQVGVDIAVPPSEPITHVRDLTNNLVGFKNLPDIRSLPFWEPSAEDRQRLPIFNPADLRKTG
jgi:II/X family phage/plasmid replication protein